MSNKVILALLRGGVSGEREVSLRTGEQIYNALDKDKYEISQFDPKTDLEEFIGKAMDGHFDIVFPALHGPFGEDGRLQGLLDLLGVKYVFSGCLASALAMNKDKTKIIAKNAGLRIIESVLIKAGNYDINGIVAKLSLPIVIKPVELGSSVGMSIAHTSQELAEGISRAFEFDSELMLEKFIKGRELTVAVMEIGGAVAPLPVIEIKPKISGWFDFKAKYEKGGSEELCPAPIPDPIRVRIQKQAVNVFEALGCADLARADFIWDEEKDELNFLEINTIPGMTATSLAPQAAAAYGLEFGDFLDKLIESALNK